MTRVVVVDDQALVRQGVRTLLHIAGIEVVGEADDGQAALAAIAATEPDVVLLDARMPRYDGLWTLRRLREQGTEVPVLVLTTFDDDELVHHPDETRRPGSHQRRAAGPAPGPAGVAPGAWSRGAAGHLRAA